VQTTPVRPLEEPQEQFGNVTVVYGHQREGDKYVAFPYRRVDTNTIVLPAPFDELSMYALRDGTQFVVRHFNDDEDAYYGGVDEVPFLVKIDAELLYTLMDKGEAAFFEALKPDEIKFFEDEFGTDGTKRQGDVYAVALPSTYTWGDLPTPAAGEHQVGETRHAIDGFWIEVSEHDAVVIEHVGGVHEICGLIAEGTLTAPDHAPLELRGPHLIAASGAIVGHGPEKVLTDIDPNSEIEFEGWIGD
jgi:hypothetical protein